MQAAVLLLSAVLVAGSSCGRASSSSSEASAKGATVQAPAASQPAVSEPVLVFTGMCDASAAVPLDAHSFVVADDEDNVLRAYDAQAPGPPLWSVDVSSAIGALPKRGKSGKAAPESDIEAATRVGELAFWMTSHGRNASGKPKPERLKLFATRVARPGEPVMVEGRAYEHLLDDLLAEPRLARFGLRAAAELPPKAKGGLNLEGMTARRDGGVWIGFRNPIPEGLALLVPLLNPEELIRGGRARLGEPRSLNLGGLGVRAISQGGSAGQYLLLAGAYDSGAGTKLYVWDGADAVTLRAEPALAGLNPEGFFSPQGANQVLVLSDDGGVMIDGAECKRLRDASKKRFRARWVKL